MELRVIDTEATAMNIIDLFYEKGMNPQMIAAYLGFNSVI